MNSLPDVKRISLREPRPADRTSFAVSSTVMGNNAFMRAWAARRRKIAEAKNLSARGAHLDATDHVPEDLHASVRE